MKKNRRLREHSSRMWMKMISITEVDAWCVLMRKFFICRMKEVNDFFGRNAENESYANVL